MHAGEIFVFIIFICLLVNSFIRPNKAKKIIEKYFRDTEIEILIIKKKYLAPLPFLFRSSTLQVWFLAKIRNKEGDTAEVYIRVGHWLAGLLEPIVQIYQIDEDGSIIDRTKRKSWLDVIFPERKN